MAISLHLHRLCRQLLFFVVALAAVPVMAQQPAMGLVNVSAASLRSAASHSSELETQAVYGTPVEILEDGDAWLLVRTPDGYVAYAHSSHIERKSQEAMALWRRSPRLIVTALQPVMVNSDTLTFSPRATVSDATLGCIFEGSVNAGSRFAEIVLPDGRKGYLPASSVEDFETRMNRPPRAGRVLDVAYSMRGVPYLWGGSTPKAIDCSGLTQLAFFDSGLLLPRNASQQANIGEELDVACPESLRAADLLFFGDGDGTKITHVAIYDADARFIHSSGRVFESSFDPADPLYIPRRVLKAVRVLSSGVVPGVLSVAAHTWYF